MKMSSDLHLFVQLIVNANWSILLLYSLFRKWDYLSKLQVVFLFVVCAGFFGINIALFDSVEFNSDWFALLFYLTQIATVLMIARMFQRNEHKSDEIKNLQCSLDVFKKINDYAIRQIWVMEYETGIMLYSNPSYQKRYAVFDGHTMVGNWDQVLIEEYMVNNKTAFEANGEVIIFEERINELETAKFHKFFAIVDNKNAIIGMSYE